jgi:hypothetical protein
MTRILLIILAAWVTVCASQTASHATTVALSWNPNTEPDIAGYKVYYKADSSSLPFNGIGAVEGSSPIEALKQTSVNISGLDPNKAYFFAVTAYNTSGMESSYSDIYSIPETASPVTSLVSPLDNATVSGIVSVTASASDNIGVTHVEFYVNGILQSSIAAVPYIFSWDTSTIAAGNYTLTTKAFDAAGNSGVSNSVSVTVVNDSIAPTISLSSPGYGSIVSGNVLVTATANDNAGVTKVEFYENGTLIFASNVAPFSYNWNTVAVANGSYILTARAYDAAGNIGQSTGIAVTVSNLPPDTTVPSVSIGVRRANSGGSGALSVTATAYDNVGVNRVEFYVNGILASTTTSAPHVFNWDSAAVPSGSYELMARAYDSAGNSARSGNVRLFVPNCQFH